MINKNIKSDNDKVTKNKKVTISKSAVDTPAVVTPTLEVSEISADAIREVCRNNSVGLNDYVIAIKRALWATKSFVGKDGEIHVEDDHDKRLKAALIGLELEGYIKNKAVTNDNSKHTHVTYSWQPVQVVNNNVENNRLN